MTLIVLLAAIVFPLIYVIDHEPLFEEIVTGIAFFVANTGSLLIYFSPKIYLVLTGATLNHKFQIVRKAKNDRARAYEMKEGTGAAAAASSTSGSILGDPQSSSRANGSGGGVDNTSLLKKYLKTLPTDTAELHHLIDLLRGCVANADLREDLSSMSSTQKSQGAASAPASELPNRPPSSQLAELDGHARFEPQVSLKPVSQAESASSQVGDSGHSSRIVSKRSSEILGTNAFPILELGSYSQSRKVAAAVNDAAVLLHGASILRQNSGGDLHVSSGV
jgi:hypothetical protein